MCMSACHSLISFLPYEGGAGAGISRRGQSVSQSSGELHAARGGSPWPCMTVINVMIYSPASECRYRALPPEISRSVMGESFSMFFVFLSCKKILAVKLKV